MPPASPQFEELDYRQTPLGELSLRRRTILSLENREVYEVKLGDAFLMSSLFTEVEVALADLGISAVAHSSTPESLSVVVGGLGLGYTAEAALRHPHTHSLLVIEYLEPVIEWHQEGLVPLGPGLSADPRCRFVHGDFFKLALGPGFDPENLMRKFDAVLLDIDHSPKHLLHERHGSFYTNDGLRKLASKLNPAGVFALWSDDPPDENFMNCLNQVFASSESHIVPFYNPLQDRESRSTVYVAKVR